MHVHCTYSKQAHTHAEKDTLNTHTQKHTKTNPNAHNYIHEDKYTRQHTHTHTHTHTHARTHTQTKIQTHANTFTHPRAAHSCIHNNRQADLNTKIEARMLHRSRTNSRVHASRRTHKSIPTREERSSIDGD